MVGSIVFRQILLFQLFLTAIITSVNGEEIPGLHQPGCILISSTLYVVGGAKKPGEQDLNSKVYKMSLSDFSDLRYEEDMGEKFPKGLLAPNLVRGKEYNSLFLVLGSKGSLISESSFTVFKRDDKLRVGSLPTDLKVKDIAGNLEAYFPAGGGLVQNDLDPNQYILYTSISIKNDGAPAYFSKTFSYNLKDNVWDVLNPSKDVKAFYQATFHIYKGVLYAIGGAEFPDETTKPLNSVDTYDIKRNEWNRIEMGGEEVGSRKIHSSVLVNNTIYLVGGVDLELVNDVVLTLNLDTRKWKKHDAKGLFGNNQGCIVNFKDKLIYTMGFTKDLKLMTQLIDIKSFDVKVNPILPLSIPAIIGVSLACFTFLALLVGLGLHFYFKSKQRNDQHNEYLLNYDKALQEHKEYVEGTSSLDTSFEDVQLTQNLNIAASFGTGFHQTNYEHTSLTHENWGSGVTPQHEI